MTSKLTYVFQISKSGNVMERNRLKLSLIRKHLPKILVRLQKGHKIPVNTLQSFEKKKILPKRILTRLQKYNDTRKGGVQLRDKLCLLYNLPLPLMVGGSRNIKCEKTVNGVNVFAILSAILSAILTAKTGITKDFIEQTTYKTVTVSDNSDDKFTINDITDYDDLQSDEFLHIIYGNMYTGDEDNIMLDTRAFITWFSNTFVNRLPKALFNKGPYSFTDLKLENVVYTNDTTILYDNIKTMGTIDNDNLQVSNYSASTNPWIFLKKMKADASTTERIFNTLYAVIIDLNKEFGTKVVQLYKKINLWYSEQNSTSFYKTILAKYNSKEFIQYMDLFSYGIFLEELVGRLVKLIKSLIKMHQTGPDDYQKTQLYEIIQTMLYITAVLIPICQRSFMTSSTFNEASSNIIKDLMALTTNNIEQFIYEFSSSYPHVKFPVNIKLDNTYYNQIIQINNPSSQTAEESHQSSTTVQESHSSSSTVQESHSSSSTPVLLGTGTYGRVYDEHNGVFKYTSRNIFEPLESLTTHSKYFLYVQNILTKLNTPEYIKYFSIEASIQASIVINTIGNNEMKIGPFKRCIGDLSDKFSHVMDAFDADLNSIPLFIKTLITSLEKMHEKDVVHCDIKPQNILLYHEDSKLVPVLHDFETCLINYDTNRTMLVSTLSYACPLHIALQMKKGVYTNYMDSYNTFMNFIKGQDPRAAQIQTKILEYYFDYPNTKIVDQTNIIEMIKYCDWFSMALTIQNLLSTVFNYYLEDADIMNGKLNELNRITKILTKDLNKLANYKTSINTLLTDTVSMILSNSSTSQTAGNNGSPASVGNKNLNTNINNLLNETLGMSSLNLNKTHMGGKNHIIAEVLPKDIHSYVQLKPTESTYAHVPAQKAIKPQLIIVQDKNIPCLENAYNTTLTIDDVMAFEAFEAQKKKIMPSDR